MKLLVRQFQYLLCCIFLVTAGLNAQTPVVSYSFAGNANDVSATKNHAAVHGAFLAQDRFGQANNAFNFDGEQGYLEAPNTAALNSDFVSVSFWLMVNELPVSGEGYPISFGGWQERYKVSLPSHGKLIWTTNSSSGISDMDAGDGNELAPGEWKHIVCVHDGTNDIIYLDGVEVASKAVSGTLNSTDKNLGIGYDVLGNGNFFNGRLDEVQIYDMALSAGEIATLYTNQSTPPIFSPGLVADFSFSNNTIDESPYGNHGSGTDLHAATDRFGFGNSAYSFNGMSSKIDASNSSVLNSDYSTVSFWIKINALPTGPSFILSHGGWPERMKIDLPGHGKPLFTTHSGGACCSDLDSGTPLTLGKWTHVVMTHDGTDDIIYFDGVQVNSKSAPGTLDPTEQQLGIGYDPSGDNAFFDGSLDEIQIYNYALAPAEVMALHNAQSIFPGIPSNLVAEYNFVGGDVDDSSIFGNHGVRSGSLPATDRFGYAANAQAFLGNESITAANSTALNSDYVTVSFWINIDAFPTGPSFIMSYGGWPERMKIDLPGHGKPLFTTHSDGACCSDLDSGTPLTPGVWTHVAMTHDGTNDIIYMDGVEVNSKSAPGTLDKTGEVLGIGYDPSGNNAFFEGRLDDIQIYNEALSAVEVAALYAEQSTPPVITGELVADYRFGGNTEDATDYHNDAWASGAQLTNDRFDQANMAYTFNGVSDKIDADNSPQLISPHTTLSFWIQVDEFPVGGDAYILTLGDWSERLKVGLPGHGKPLFTTHSGGACCSDLDSGTPLSLGVWTHVVMTHDGINDIIYMNGDSVNGRPAPGDLDPTLRSLGIGYNSVGNGNFFNGSLDEVQIYNMALTAQQVADLYAAQSQPPVVTDTEAPTAPLELKADVEFNNIALNWLPSSDNIGVAGYNVFQDGAKMLTTSGTTADFLGLTPLTEFEFSVSAVDEAGNESLPTFLKATSGLDQAPDTTAPTKPGNIAASMGAHSALISWDASIDDVLVAGYVVLLDGLFSDSLPGDATSVFISGLDAETAYTFEVYAYDLAGNVSEIAEITESTEKEIDTGEPGLVAWYPFDGNANDATPYENHGVIGGNPVFEAVTHPNGTGNMAIVFDGDRDSVLAPNAVQLISDYTTVGFWIRVDAVTTDPEAYVIDFGNWDERWKISLPQHLKIVWTTNITPGTFAHDMDSGDGNEMVLGFWWYVTMVHDGIDNIIYVDGLEVANIDAEDLLNSTGRPLGMGNNPDNGGQYFTGALDEVKIYNVGLTPEEVALLYADGSIVGIDDGLNGELGSVVQSIYPNPVTEKLIIDHNINHSQPLLLRVFDTKGRQIDAVRFDKNEVPEHQFSVDVEQYASGNYLLNFVLGGKNLGSIKFNKQ